MMKRTPDKVINELEMGYTPYEMAYGLEPVPKIDWMALHYNYWDSDDFWREKLIPEGLIEQFPCLEEWAEEVVKSREKKTPLEEVTARIMERKEQDKEAKEVQDKMKEKLEKKVDLYDI